MKKEINVGPLTFIGELAGAHVHVEIRGVGRPGSRPLCGMIAMTETEWNALTAFCEPPNDANVPDPHATLVWAIVRRLQHEHDPAPGQLAMIELPKNCTIHEADAQRLIRIVSLAEQIGAHWRDQEGVNSGLIDQLSHATEPR